MLLLFTCALNPTANAPDLAANALDLAGQVPSPLEQMNLLDSVHHNLIQDFNPVKKERYINNAIYDCIRCLGGVVVVAGFWMVKWVAGVEK
jgi:hypothetical protein